MLPLPTLTAYQESLQRAVTALAQHDQMTQSLVSTIEAELTNINAMVIAAQQGQQAAAPAAPPPPPVWNPTTQQWDVQQPAPAASPAGPLGYPPPAHMQAPSFPGPGVDAGAPPVNAAPPAAAPAAPATAAPAAGGRKRRTKAQIADDEAAIARGFLSAADEAAKMGVGAGNAPGGAGGQAPAQVPPAAMAPGNAAVPPVSGAAVPAGMPAAPPATVNPLAKGAEDVQAAFMKVVAAVEAVWPGHGEGQAGLLFTGVFPGVPNIHSLPTEQSQGVAIQWANHFIAQFIGQKLPQGVATPGFLPNSAPQ